MNLTILAQFLSDANQPAFRYKQIKRAIYQEGVPSFSQITSLPKDLRQQLADEIPVLSFAVKQILVAKDKQSAKAVLQLMDGNLLETVLMSPKPGLWSVCVSSQVGCPLGCGFCATGLGGFKRDLTAEEITDQVLFWKQWLNNDLTANPTPLKSEGNHLTNIVYMGMGEPFLNWPAVSESLRTFTDQDLFGFGSRNLSISTAGIPEGIESLAKEFPQVNLAISLHFASDEKRSKFMPINRKYNLESLRTAIKKYFTLTNRKVFIEYLMLSGINDSLEDAQKLAQLVGSMGYRQLLHVNLIRYNATDSQLAPSNRETTQRFKAQLEKYSVSVTIRKSLGEDISGACGQLAGKVI